VLGAERGVWGLRPAASNALSTIPAGWCRGLQERPGNHSKPRDRRSSGRVSEGRQGRKVPPPPRRWP
jgi:hypothetical protein